MKIIRNALDEEDLLLLDTYKEILLIKNNHKHSMAIEPTVGEKYLKAAEEFVGVDLEVKASHFIAYPNGSDMPDYHGHGEDIVASFSVCVEPAPSFPLWVQGSKLPIPVVLKRGDGVLFTVDTPHWRKKNDSGQTYYGVLNFYRRKDGVT